MSYTHLFTFKVGPKWLRCHSLSNDWHVAKANGLYRLAQTARPICKRERERDYLYLGRYSPSLNHNKR